jgi:hypothetical protein
MTSGRPRLKLGRVVPSFLLSHQHAPGECRSVYAAWQGFESPLRHHCTLSSCVDGGHGIWWTVTAPNADAALALLPRFVAVRTTPIRVREVRIP